MQVVSSATYFGVNKTLDLPQVDSLVCLVMTPYIGTKKIKRAKTPEINQIYGINKMVNNAEKSVDISKAKNKSKI